MSGTSVIKQLPPKDLRAELRNFIAGASRPSATNQLELARKSLTLLRALPAARDAVFEFLGTVFDKSVSNYMNELENESKNSGQHLPKEDAVVDELHGALSSFLISNPATWALLISKWALELLGSLSSKYSRRGRAPVNGLLSDSLQQWMSCRATRCLLDINHQCFLTLVESYNEITSVNVLLDTCVVYSPHFDWVVAHVASCFPTTVIKRVLSWSLKDFIGNFNSTNRPKLNSAIGILIHLTGSHSPEIRAAMLNLFKWSLEAKNVNEEKDVTLEKSGVVPFLMRMGSLSPVLLMSLSADTLLYLNVDLLKNLKQFSDQWIGFTGSRQSLLDILIHLILYSEDRAEHILTLLLDASECDDPVISSVTLEVLELLLKELDVSVRVNAAKIPLLDCLLKKIDWLLPMALSERELRVSTAVTILSLIGQQQPGVLAKCTSYLLLRSTNDDHLASVVKFTHGCRASQVLTPAIALSVTGFTSLDKPIPQHLWTNLSKLQKWETSGTLISLPVQQAVWDNLIPIGELICETTDAQLAHSMADVIKRAVLSSKTQPDVHLTMVLVQATVSYFYICVMHSEGVAELKGMRVVNLLLTKLCQGSTIARAIVLRELLESALFRAPSVLFGAVPMPGNRLIVPPSSLLTDNHKQGTTTLLAQRHSSVFHAGIIGTGKRKVTPSCPTPHGKVTHNTYLLMSSLKACCSCDSPQATLDAVISLALLLVELISPDVMYNGLPWPEEEFCKVTVERDLYIRRVFDSMPLLWSLLAFIAYHRPALCYCSVLLRALVATLLGQWSSSSQQGRGPGHNKALISTTTRVLQIMAMGQLLPPPLNALSDIIQHLPPLQVVLVLRDCVWNYMRDHVPSPALFTRDANGAMWRDPSTSRPPKQYTETLRLVMQRNIMSLGQLYNTLFVNDTMEED